MRWLKRDSWKVGITLAGLLLFLVLMVWVPASSVGASEKTSEPATPVTGTVQTTPTEDATVAALNKEKLKQDVTQIADQNDPTVTASNKEKLQDENNWLWTNGATILSSVLSALLIVGGGIFALLRWLDDRQKERKANEQQQEKERFESLSSVILGLGDEKDSARVGAAIMLRAIFLRPGFEQFYTQVFYLAVDNLCLLRSSNPPEDPNTSLQLTSLSQELIRVFKEAFPLAQIQNKGGPQSLDATGIQLDNAYLVEASLKGVWMPSAYLRKAHLSGANLSEAKLGEADLVDAHLEGARLREADLIRTILIVAHLSEAKLSGADLSGADLSGAKLIGANLSRNELPSSRSSATTALSGTGLTRRMRERDNKPANLSGANLSLSYFSGANLSGANLSLSYLSKADLSGANLSKADLSGVLNLEDALSLEYTNLHGVIGLTKPQLEFCEAKVAIVDKVCSNCGALNPSEESFCSNCGAMLSSVSPLSQSTNVQTPSAPSAQESTPTPDIGGSNISERERRYAAFLEEDTPTPDIGGSSTTSSEPGSQS